MQKTTQQFWLFIGFLSILTALRLCLAATLGLTSDESYYWLWSKHLQLSYLDHPPAVALMIRSGTLLWGDSALGIRFFGPVLAFAGSLLVVQAGKDFLGDWRAGMRAALLLNATLFLGIGSGTATPDTPLIFFLAVALWAMARLYASDNPAYWLAIGLAFGLAFDSKYTALLPAIACAIWWIFSFKRPHLSWVAAGGALGFVCISPILIWNAQHGFASFIKQGGRAQDWHPWKALQYIGELLGGQVGLATPLIFILIVIGVISAMRVARRGNAYWLLAALVLVPSGVFLQHAFGGRVQANWPVVLYPPAVILAARVRGVSWAAGFGFVISALVYLQVFFHVVPLPPKMDVVARQTAGWSDLATTLSKGQWDQGVLFDDYARASIVHFYAPHLPVYSSDPRWRYLGDSLSVGGGLRSLILLKPAGAREEIPAGWSTAGKAVEKECRKFRGQNVQCYRLQTIRANGLSPVDIWRVE